MAQTDKTKADPRRVALLGRLRSVNRKLRALRPLEQERLNLLNEARTLVPPVTFRDIAAACEVTESAIQQALRKQQLRKDKRSVA